MGAIITKDFSDNKDIARQMRGNYARGNMIVKCFKHCTKDVKVLLFKTFCSNMYCSETWCNFSKTNMEQLKVSYNRIFRYMFDLVYRISVSGTMIDFNVTPFKILVRQYILNFKQRLQNSDNIIVNALVNSMYFYSCPIYKRWCCELYVLK